MINNNETPLSLRLTSKQRISIESISKEQGIDFSKMIRRIVDEWLDNYHKKPLSKLDEAKLKAISETLYIIRGMADKFDPQLKDAAKAHAFDVIKKIKEHQSESSRN